METYLDPERQQVTETVIEERRIATKKKFAEVMDFLRG